MHAVGFRAWAPSVDITFVRKWSHGGVLVSRQISDFDQTVERLEVGSSRLGWSLHCCIVSLDTKMPLFVQVY